MKVRIWGARGSIPTPLSPEKVEEKICWAILGMPDIDTNNLEAIQAYVRKLPPLVRGTAGNNTSCVEIQTEGETFIIDAGTGLRELGLKLMQGPCGRGQGTLHLFVSHSHWDHIQGFPFFVPAFIPGNHIFIYGVHDLQTVFEDQQRPLNFPVPLSYMQAKIEFVSLQLGQPFSIGQVCINTIQNAHPGDSYGFRFEDPHSVLVYASDVEFEQSDVEDASVRPHVEFFEDADALIFDAQYTLREAWQKVDWGHSSALIGVDLARAAGVKQLILFHHDPAYSDAELRTIRSTAITYQAQDTTLPTCEVIVAYEGLTLDLTPPGAVAVQFLPDDEAAVLTPTSVFDERGVNQVAEQLAYLAEQDASASPIIDLSQVETLTTASLKLLIKLRRKEESTSIVLAAPIASVRRVIELAGYSDYFAIYPSVDAALEAVQIREALNLPGQVIKGRYQIEEKVAEGWLGTVLKATDIRTGRSVAIKVISSAFSAETMARFMRQVKQAAALDHRNIVQVFAWDRDEGHTFIAEELMTGPMLHDILADEDISLPADRAMDIALNIARALEYAHSRGMILGDLKPRNVFLTDDADSGRSTVKLSGFGLARLEEGRNLLDAPLLFLVPAYLAPEQIMGQTLDARTDLYALGVILYELFTGRLPFEGSDWEVMQAHLRQAPRAPRELNSHVSVSLEHLMLKLLVKNPNDRYASAQQVRHILSSLAVGVEDVTRQRWQLLVGREEPVQALQACWGEARAGRGQLAFITGEPGIGKTILVQQVAARSHPPVLLTGRCQELEGEPAYDLFAQVLREYFATVPPELLDGEACQLIGNFARLVPEIRQMLPDLPEPLPLEPEQEQLRLMTSLTQFIQRATQERPWFIILDGLQWADQSSLELLRYIGRHLPSMPVMIIGTYRDVEVGPGHPLLETLRDLRSHPTYHHFPLARLDQAGVGQVLDHLWEQSVPADLTEMIYHHTEGNPFYVEEVARGLADDGLVTLQDGVYHFPTLEEVRLPESVREVVWRRIGHLGLDTQALLHCAAVLGLTFKLDDLQEMSDLSEWQVLEHLGLALERQLVQEVPGDTMLRFRHAEIQSVLYADLGSLRRRILHRQAGQALEQRAQPEPERIAEQLAHHFGEAGDFERAVVYSNAAARQAQDAYANETALLWHERTLDMLNQIDSKHAPRFQSLHLSACVGLGEVLTLVGRYAEALEHYASARVLVETETVSVEQTLRLTDLCYQTAGVHEKRSEYFIALEWLEKGLGYLVRDKPTIEMARIYRQKAFVYHRQGRNEEAIDWCQKSLAVALEIETRDGQQIVARVYSLSSLIHRLRGDFPRAVQFGRESVQVYQQIGDRTGQMEAHNNLASAYADQGDWDRASNTYHKSLAIAHEIDSIYHQGVIANNLAEIHRDRGEWTRASSLYEQSRVIWEQIGVPWAEAVTLSNLAQVHIYQENWAEAQKCLSRSQALFVEVGSEASLPELMRRWGELYLNTGELEQALAYTRRSIELSVVQSNPLEEGISCRMLGQVHLARGEREPAEATLHQSLQILGDLNSEYEGAKTKLSLVRLAMETGVTVTEEGLEYLAQAIETFEKLGAQADLAKARELEKQL